MVTCFVVDDAALKLLHSVTFWVHRKLTAKSTHDGELNTSSFIDFWAYSKFFYQHFEDVDSLYLLHLIANARVTVPI
jgi:hypothetical protein